MKWIRKYLTPDEIKKISDAVGEAESRTIAEIVPMVVRKSSPTGHVTPLLVSLFLIGFLFFNLHNKYLYECGEWIYLIMLFLAVLFAWPLSQLPWLQRLLTSNVDEAHQVHVRAEIEFYRHIKDKTSHRTGVLLFVSMMERRAVVLADQAIAAQVPKETWDQIVTLIISGVKRGSLADGFISAVRECEKHLVENFPASGKHSNEISNQLIIKD